MKKRPWSVSRLSTLAAETKRREAFLKATAARLPISRPAEETTAQDVLDMLNSPFYRAAGKTYRILRHAAHFLRGSKIAAKHPPKQT